MDRYSGVGLHPKAREILKLYHFPFKSYSQCKALCGQTDEWTNGVTEKQTGAKTLCPQSIDAGAKKYISKQT